MIETETGDGAIPEGEHKAILETLVALTFEIEKVTQTAIDRIDRIHDGLAGYEPGPRMESRPGGRS